MTQQSDDEPMLDIARGDAALSKHLHNSLSVLRNKVDDPEFKNMVDDVINGKTSLRDVASSSVFSRALDPFAREAERNFENMTEEERDELARTGEEQFEDLRNSALDKEETQSKYGSNDNEEEDLGNRSWLE